MILTKKQRRLAIIVIAIATLSLVVGSISTTLLMLVTS